MNATDPIVKLHVETIASNCEDDQGISPGLAS
jgi:hypothetical protein